MANYPLPKFHFQVEWGGVKIGFSEVSGLDMTIEYGTNQGWLATASPRNYPYRPVIGTETWDVHRFRHIDVV